MSKNHYPYVTIVIPTLNAENFLPFCLQAIKNQRYPKDRIEILVVDGGSIDNTKEIAKKFGACIINNPYVFMEPAKTIGTKKAKGEIIFYIDSDNILSKKDWLHTAVLPLIKEHGVSCILPQTIPDPNSHPINRYFGYLFTDPFTWFVYHGANNPKYYENTFTPVKKTEKYILYRFPEKNPPLFGFSQGVGAIKKFGHGTNGYSDDLLSGISAIQRRALIAYVPDAGVYHYHITGLSEFIKKYSWRVKNNLKHRYVGVGINERTKFFSLKRKLRMYLFIPYGLSCLFPLLDAFKLMHQHKSMDMFLHVPLCFIMALIIIKERIHHSISPKQKIGLYE